MKVLRWLAAVALATAALVGPAAAQDIQFAPGAPYVHAASGMVFPVQVGDFLRGRGYRYAADGSDESVAYHLGRIGGEITATVYVSPSPALQMGPDADPLALSAAQGLLCSSQFNTMRQEIDAAYHDEMLLSEGEADMYYARAVSRGFTASYTFTAGSFWGRRNVSVRSDAYLFCYVGGRWSVKYRFMYPAETDASADIAAFTRALRWTIGGEPGYSTGTGFLVSEDGLIVTNSRLVAGARSIEVIANGQSIPATVVSADPTNDIAVLRATVTGTPLTVAPAGAARRGEDVLAVGYARVDIQGQTQSAAFGRVNALTGAEEDPRYLQIDVPIQPGNSGAPLLNRRGQVVGVLTASREQSLTVRSLDAPAPIVNYALKSDYVLPLLTTPATPAAVRSSGLREIADVARAVESGIFLVVARR